MLGLIFAGIGAAAGLYSAYSQHESAEKQEEAGEKYYEAQSEALSANKEYKLEALSKNLSYQMTDMTNGYVAAQMQLARQARNYSSKHNASMGLRGVNAFNSSYYQDTKNEIDGQYKVAREMKQSIFTENAKRLRMSAADERERIQLEYEQALINAEAGMAAQTIQSQAMQTQAVINGISTIADFGTSVYFNNKSKGV